MGWSLTVAPLLALTNSGVAGVLSGALDTLWNAVQVAVGIGLVIFVHELGHFLVAKWNGVKCEKFYLGFGPKIVHFQWGETEYGVGLLPLGGYVKMLGQNDSPSDQAAEVERSKVATTNDGSTVYDPRSYLAKSVLQRMAIISAGVIMNVIFAFIACFAAFFIGVKTLSTEVSGVSPGGPAWQAGLKAGDVITRVGDLQDPNFTDLSKQVMLKDFGPTGIPLTVRRPDGSTYDVALVPMQGDRPYIGVRPAIGVRLSAQNPVQKGSPADLTVGKLEGGDLIVKVDDVEVKGYGDLLRALAGRANQSIRLTVKRADPNDPTKTTEAVATIAPNPFKTVGLEMSLGKIAAIQRGSPAEQAGFKVDDVIAKINGQDAGDPMTLGERLHKLAGQTVAIAVQREGVDGTASLSVVPADVPAWINPPDAQNDPLEIPSLGIACRVVNRIRAVAPEAKLSSPSIPADQIASKIVEMEVTGVDVPVTGLIAKETSVKFDPAKLNWPHFYHSVLQAAAPGAKLVFHLRKGEQTYDVTAEVYQSDDFFDRRRGLMLEQEISVRKTSDVSQAAGWALNDTASNLVDPFRVIAQMFARKLPTEAVGGPVRIFSEASGFARRGPGDFLYFLAMLSANLAVINFLPIPVLDGGHMVFLLYELVRGKPASEKFTLVLTLAGLFFLLGLFFLVTLQDIMLQFFPS